MLDSAGPTISEYVGALRRRWWLVALVTALAVVVGAVPTLLEDPTYESEVLVRDSYTTRQTATEEEIADEEAEVDGEEPAPERPDESTSQLLELGSDLTSILTNRFRAEVVERMGPGAEPFGEATASLVGFSTTLRIRVTAGSPEAAAAAAQAYAEEFVEWRRADAIEPYVDMADELRSRAEEAEGEAETLAEQLRAPEPAEAERSVLESQRSEAAAEARSLRERADDLRLEADLRESGIEVISDAPADSAPIAPERRRALGAALVIGVLVGVAAALLLDRFRRPPTDD